METVPRMTRSRARAEQSKTPLPGMATSKTPAKSARTTRKKKEEQEADVMPTELFKDTAPAVDAPTALPTSDVLDQGEHSLSASCEMDLGQPDSTTAPAAAEADQLAASCDQLQEPTPIDAAADVEPPIMPEAPLSPAVVVEDPAHVTEQLLSTAAPADAVFAVPASQEFQFELPSTTAELGSLEGFLDGELCEDNIEWPDESLSDEELGGDVDMDMQAHTDAAPPEQALPTADVPAEAVAEAPASPLPTGGFASEQSLDMDAMDEDVEAPPSPAPSPEPEPEVEAEAPPTPPPAQAAASPQAAHAVSKFLSKTPQPAPRTSSRTAAKQSLTTVKPAAPGSKISLTPGPVPYKGSSRTATAAAPPAEQHHVKFQTPSKDTPAASSSRKGVLKPSTHFSTPSAAAAASKTRDAASTKSSKRVSISTPVHPKSAGGPRSIVRTPYPKSATKDEEDEEELVCEEEAGSMMETQDDLEDIKVATPLGPSFDDADAALHLSQEQQQEEEELSLKQQPSPAAAVMDTECQDECMGDAEEQGDAPERSASEAGSQEAGGSSDGATSKGLTALKALAAAESRPVSGGSVPHYMAPTSLSKSRLKSKVVVTDTYDPRSLNQIRKQIKELTGVKAPPAPVMKTKAAAAQVQDLTSIRKTRLVDKPIKRADKGLVRDEDDDVHDQSELPHNKASEDVLTAAMDKLLIGPKPTGSKVAPLKGLPVPQGRHVRFNSKGKPVESPSSAKPQLRGMPAATGTHLRFKD